MQPLATRYELQRGSPIYVNGRSELCTHLLTGRKLVQIPEHICRSPSLPTATPHLPPYASRTPQAHLQRRSECYVKQSPFGTPMLASTRFRQRPSDSSITTSGYGTQATPNERAAMASRQLEALQAAQNVALMTSSPKDSPLLFKFAQESPLTSYGIRIQGLQRARMLSEESANNRATMTPPNSLNRKRWSGSFSGSERSPAATTALQSPLYPASGAKPLMTSSALPVQSHMRVGSPDLPTIHYQRFHNGANVNAGVTSQMTSQPYENTHGGGDASLQTNGVARQTSFTQSQILAQGLPSPVRSENIWNRRSAEVAKFDAASNACAPGQQSPFVPVTSCNTNTNGSGGFAQSHRYSSSTRTPSSNRSSAETVRSVTTSCRAINQDRSTQSPRVQHTLPSCIEDETDETVDQSQAPQVSDTLTEDERALRNSISDATGSEIAEMDCILRDLGCTPITSAVIKGQGYSLDAHTNSSAGVTSLSQVGGGEVGAKYKILAKFDRSTTMTEDTHQSNSLHVTSPGQQQISEYENDDDTTDVSSACDAKPPAAPVRRHDVITQNDVIAYIQGRRFPSSHLGRVQQVGAAGAQYTSSSSQDSPRYQNKLHHPHFPDLANLPLSRYILVNDDSSSTNSDVYGIPKSRRNVKGVVYNDLNAVKGGESGEGTPPPLPPPPSMEALFASRLYENTQGTPANVNHSGSVCAEASAFRPVNILDSSAFNRVSRDGKTRPVGPVRPIPASGSTVTSPERRVSGATSIISQVPRQNSAESTSAVRSDVISGANVQDSDANGTTTDSTLCPTEGAVNGVTSHSSTPVKTRNGLSSSKPRVHAPPFQVRSISKYYLRSQLCCKIVNTE